LNYTSGTNLPKYVKKALDDGYTIVHKGLLCWIPIPIASLHPTTRLLFLALEAMFAYAFWAMQAKRNDYGMAQICLWDRFILEYDGCCSHCSLNEGVNGDFELSVEQLGNHAAQKKSKQAINIANHHYKQMATNHDEYLDKAAERTAKWIAKDPTKFRELRTAHKRKGTYHCELCGISCHDRNDLNAHLTTSKHLNQAENLANNPYRCGPCSHSSKKSKGLYDHRKSKRHQKQVAALSSSQLG
jgi:hypothetical protein